MKTTGFFFLSPSLAGDLNLYLHTFSSKVLHKWNKIIIYSAAVKMISPVKVLFKETDVVPGTRRRCEVRDVVIIMSSTPPVHL